MATTASLIPQILIHFAPNDDATPQPPSPITPSTPSDDDDSPRSPHLMPPPTMSPTARLSPLRPPETVKPSTGLDRSRFESLLQSTRERNAAVATSGKRSIDLRKEVALKAHKSKQEERRALFLSKIQSPPSPTATVTPATPPESPAVFHFTLPSPGLISPLALFEAIGTGERPVRVEQIDFRQQARKNPTTTATSAKPPKALPSLDQISARLVTNAARAHSPAEDSPPVSRPRRAPIPLPAFLTSPGQGRPHRSPSPPQQQQRALPVPVIRVAPPPPCSAPVPAVTSPAMTVRPRPAPINARSTSAQAMLERLSRRFSSPPEMSNPAFRMGEVFGRHRVLLMPGGF